MKRIIKFGSIGLVIAGAIAVVGEAYGQVPALSKKNGIGGVQITIFGTPRTQVPVALSGLGTQVKKSFRADACGLIVIPNANQYANLTTPAGSVNVSAVFLRPVASKPTCTMPGFIVSSLPNSPDQAWNLGNNSILIATGIDASAPNGRFVDVTYSDNSPKSRFVSLNACGLGSVKAANTLGSIALDNGSPIAIGALPFIGAGLRCSGAIVLGSQNDFPTIPALPIAFKDDNNNIFIKTTAGATVTVGLEAQASTKSATSDRCGGLTIGSQLSPQTTPFTLNGVTIDPSTLSVGLKPNCKNNGGTYAYDVTPTGNFKTSNGQVFIKNDATYPEGFGDRRILQITTTGSANRSLTANQCVLATIRSTNSSPILSTTTFTYNNNTYEVGNLPIEKAACYNVGDSNVPRYELFRALN